MVDENVSNTFFSEMLYAASDYVWFYTPYLMLGDSLFDAFIRAAKRGVDVRIILPGIEKLLSSAYRGRSEDI